MGKWLEPRVKFVKGDILVPKDGMIFCAYVSEGFCLQNYDPETDIGPVEAYRPSKGERIDVYELRRAAR
jgi:hypothetical protein